MDIPEWESEAPSGFLTRLLTFLGALALHLLRAFPAEIRKGRLTFLEALALHLPTALRTRGPMDLRHPTILEASDLGHPDLG